jgi:hypothetical protein
MNTFSKKLKKKLKKLKGKVGVNLKNGFIEDLL